MSLTIMKRIRFCAGHRLFGHEGKCAFFHGHNYIADIYVTGEETDEVGRLVDFAHLKKAFKGWIDENWDHAFLLNVSDENGIDAIKRVEPSKYFILPYNPTAENIAKYLLENVAVELMENQPHSVSKVVIWETEDSFAEASVEQSSEFMESYPEVSAFVKSYHG
ncbi:6-carboxytetrahydropterin synthase [Rubinisphaera sp.]|uniref:6-pyruvoyl trahydropterin synthase family protein n=2 Tax=Rubinisphaera TaxID=1649490 RepID=UPI000C0D6736|nr:6-carboxytetrahydropterin synthase [Rubinisphaera sp.]MBV07714.1 6-pyruvoyl tetrahydrobiopterin synthase [Rubinisphaera sp.]HCS52758.1 6-carboxytetrahydropterin synthase [Planctomycetaceae bacterium]|tara:strand:+ start:395 stop:886 length:492 start_codon:yes stop_codon:yes gene_type:complete